MVVNGSFSAIRSVIDVGPAIEKWGCTNAVAVSKTSRRIRTRVMTLLEISNNSRISRVRLHALVRP
jgi:hypothetical protein